MIFAIRNDKGFTIVEVLIASTVIGILLALSIPNLVKARISSNEACAKKSMQTLRDAEAIYFEQDADNNGVRDYTSQIGDLSTTGTLRCPLISGSGCMEEGALIDLSFQSALAIGNTANCADPKAGYCMQFSEDVDLNNTTILQVDFGWEASMTSAYKTGRRDFAVYADKTTKCIFSQKTTGNPGIFEADRTSPGCDN